MYILTLHCKDQVGIVSAVSNLLCQYGAFIVASSQFGDSFSGNFFMRVVFSLDTNIAPLEYAFRIDVGKRFSMHWQIWDNTRKMRVLIMASKESHCLNNILHHYSTGRLPVIISAVAANHETLREMVDWYKLPFYFLPITPETKLEQEKELWSIIRKLKIDLVVLARYMQILSPNLLAELEGCVINIHHSFLPSFKGAKPYHQAYRRGVKIIGATAHYVSNDLDEGPIIEQEVLRVDHADSSEMLASLGSDIEQLVLLRAITAHIERRVLINGNKTVIFK